VIFPGGVGVSELRVYDWPAPDGRCGGTPHLHLACAEAYVVVEGAGAVQTLTFAGGHAETPLVPGEVVWFAPGTVHRLVNGDGRLRIVVVMQNSGLPEAGDAVFTFPPEILADPEAYGRAATIAGPDDARRRRDLALRGFLELREAGRDGLAAFHRAALALVADRLPDFEGRWRSGALAAAEETGRRLARLRDGDAGCLREGAVHRIPAEPRLGMCGHLRTYPLDDTRTDPDARDGLRGD
jgi:mannose-6-phosphate isomerase-like protein (cupin superfamily)